MCVCQALLKRAQMNPTNGLKHSRVEIKTGHDLLCVEDAFKMCSITMRLIKNDQRSDSVSAKTLNRDWSAAGGGDQV